MEDGIKDKENIQSKDYKLNITSLILPFFLIFLSLMIIGGGSSGNASTGAGSPGLLAVAIGISGVSFMVGLILAVIAISRNEPRKGLSIIAIILNLIGSLLISGFFNMVEF